MTLGRFGVIALCLAFGVGHAGAQTVTVEFQNGTVTLSAQNATPRQILAEWAKVGGTRIVNGDRVPGTPMTIELVGVSERQALDVILRSASGYMAAARTSGRGASGLDRVHILPTSTATPARPGAAPATAQQGRAFPLRTAAPVPAPEQDLDNELPEPEEPPVVNPARVPPGQIPGGRPGANAPFPMSPNVPDPDDDVDESDVTADDSQPTNARPTPSNPFGVVPGSISPGVVNPQAPQPGQAGPTQTTRPTQPLP